MKYRLPILIYPVFFCLLEVAGVAGAFRGDSVSFLRYLILFPLAADLLSMACLLRGRSGIGAASMVFYVLVVCADSQPILFAPSESIASAVIRKLIEGVFILLFHLATNCLVPWLFARRAPKG